MARNPPMARRHIANALNLLPLRRHGARDEFVPLRL